jgi:hypothetical protein
LQFHAAISGTKVIPPPTDNQIEIFYYFFQRITQSFPLGDLMDLLPYRFHGLLTGPHVRQKLVGFLSSHLVEMKSKKVETFLSHVHNTGLGGMKCQLQFGHDLLDLLQSFLGFSLGATDDRKIIRIPNQLAQG